MGLQRIGHDLATEQEQQLKNQNTVYFQLSINTEHFNDHIIFHFMEIHNLKKTISCYQECRNFSFSLQNETQVTAVTYTCLNEGFFHKS